MSGNPEMSMLIEVLQNHVVRVLGKRKMTAECPPGAVGPPVVGTLTTVSASAELLGK